MKVLVIPLPSRCAPRIDEQPATVWVMTGGYRAWACLCIVPQNMKRVCLEYLLTGFRKLEGSETERF
jgi:hypothetical protein